MSTWYDLRCDDCRETLGCEWLRGDDCLRYVWARRALFRNLKAIRKEVAFEFYFYGSPAHGPEFLEFCEKHFLHRVVMFDEYGRDHSLDDIQWHRDPAASGVRWRAFVDKYVLVAYERGDWWLEHPPTQYQPIVSGYCATLEEAKQAVVLAMKARVE